MLWILTTPLLSIERAAWLELHDMFKARDDNAWQFEFPVGFPDGVPRIVPRVSY